MENVLIGLYRSFTGDYVFVHNIVTDKYGDNHCVYYDVLHPEKGFMSRPVTEWFDTVEKDELPFETPIEKIAQNETKQVHRYEKVTSIEDSLKNYSTKQLIEELGKRTDSPLQHLDFEDLSKKVLDYDYIIGFPTYVEDEGKDVFSVSYADDDLDRVRRYFQSHRHLPMEKIYKRTCMEVED